MIPTHGLTHLSFAVANPERSLRFYAQVFGVRESARDAEEYPGAKSRAASPEPHDVLAFEQEPENAGVKIHARRGVTTCG